MKINWDELANIKELQSYFQRDFVGFKIQIEKFLAQWSNISESDLDKLALIRALEVTNGCTQWAHRRGDPESLSIEQTRRCMKLSMSSIKNKQITLKNNTSINFSPEMQTLIDVNREIYIDAFKNNIEGKEQEFYALSTAQFLTYGQDRMEKSFQIIRDNYEDYFTDFYLKKGVKYVQPYLDSLG